MMYKIYLVEDENNLNELLTSYLRHEGWEVTSFLTGNEALKSVDKQPHLWILDIMLPDIDGYQLLQKIKLINPQIPTIFISARDADLDRILGLEMGSDDYIAKPFMPRELVIRVRKLLNRVYENDKSTKSEEKKYNYLSYKIDINRRIVTLGDKNLNLTSKEFDLLIFFIENEQQAFSRDQILSCVWEEGYFGTDRVVDDLVRRLRKKMPDLRIETIYGYGYRLIMP